MKKQVLVPVQSMRGWAHKAPLIVEETPQRDDSASLQEQIDSGEVDPAYLVPDHATGRVHYRPPVEL